ncbi:V-type proton ATPase subunit S1 [Aricia agestis]|uniref:V-type proton ATPase subunit S1 n=1 Tax=Aricia agestis TaxID=91739 RepID=UPI001C207721|nr:V-type proton ATPase subunit S1 [Aricia agestis]
MAFCRLVFPLLVLSVLGGTFAQVPVYIWGDVDGTSTKSNPLSTLSEAEFKGVLKRELVDDAFTVIFIDETLSVEDFSRRPDGENSFPYLQANIGKALYLPSVDNSLTVLNGLADPEKVDHVKLTENGLSAEIEPDSGKFLFIVLKDAREGESRVELLKRHDDFMEKMVGELQERYSKVLAIYTAEYPSWVIPEAHSRARRQAEMRQSENTTDFMMNGLRLYAKAIRVSDGSETNALTGFATSKTTFGESSMATEMNFDNNVLTLNFTKYMGYWYFDTVTITQTSPRQFTHELLPKSEVYAIMDFSYRCGQSVSFTNINETESITLTFEDLKVQPFFKESNASDPLVFGESLNCIGFFSVPIWAGLFVTFILLSITFYGIMMMMDIRTMDRFDDPKGKTITINAGE